MELQIFFEFSTRTLGEIIQLDDHIFQMGWLVQPDFNQQLIATSYFWAQKTSGAETTQKRKHTWGEESQVIKQFFLTAFPTNVWGEF